MLSCQKIRRGSLPSYAIPCPRSKKSLRNEVLGVKPNHKQITVCKKRSVKRLEMTLKSTNFCHHCIQSGTMSYPAPPAKWPLGYFWFYLYKSLWLTGQCRRVVQTISRNPWAINATLVPGAPQRLGTQEESSSVLWWSGTTCNTGGHITSLPTLFPSKHITKNGTNRDLWHHNAHKCTCVGSGGTNTVRRGNCILWQRWEQSGWRQVAC